MKKSTPYLLFFALAAATQTPACSDDKALTVHAALIGGGEITSTPPGLRCSGTRECEPQRFAKRESVELTAGAEASGSPFTGWLVWSGKEDEEPSLVLDRNITLTVAQADEDGNVYALAFFGLEPTVDAFNGAGTPGTGGGGAAGSGAGAAGSGGGSANGGSGPRAGTGGGGGAAGGQAGTDGGEGGTDGGQGGAGGGAGGARGITCTSVTPNPVVEGRFIKLSGTGFGPNTTVTCFAARFELRFEDPVASSETELEARAPFVSGEAECTLRIANPMGTATCPSPLKIVFDR